MAYVDYWAMLGYNNNAQMFMEVFGGTASNVILTDNPEYTREMFSQNFPAFLFSEDGSVEGSIPIPVQSVFRYGKQVHQVRQIQKLVEVLNGAIHCSLSNTVFDDTAR